MPNRYYPVFDFYNMKKAEGLHIIERFSTIFQTTDFTCGICCAMMVLTHHNLPTPCEADFAAMCRSKPYTGTRLIDLINVLRGLCDCKIVSTYDLKKDDGLCFESYEKFKAFALESIDKNIPIIVQNCDYGGHYRVLIGFDEVSDNPEEDVLIFADPSDFNDGCRDGYNFFPAERFFYMWFDDHCLEEEVRKQAFIQIIRR